MAQGRDFPGVEPESEFLREYPHGPVGAHLFGQVGEVTEIDLERKQVTSVVLGRPTVTPYDSLLVAAGAAQPDCTRTTKASSSMIGMFTSTPKRIHIRTTGSR